MATVNYTSGGYGIGGGMAGPSRNISGITIEGLPELLAALDAWGPRAKTKLGLALEEVCQELITKAKWLTPHDFGYLRASGHVESAVESPVGVSVTCGFGGNAGVGNVAGESNAEAVNYAVYVHEDLSKRHEPPYGKGGQAKFLETPLLELAPNLEHKLAAILRDELSRAA